MRWNSIPSRGSRNAHSRFMLQNPEISSDLKGHLARIQALPTKGMNEKYANSIPRSLLLFFGNSRKIAGALAQVQFEIIFKYST